MIIKFIRRFSIAHVTALKAKLTTRMLDPNSISYKIFKSIVQVEELQILKKFFNQTGYELRIAGGAVRDLLCEQHPHDLDFATTATPKQMIDLLKDKNIRLITTPAGERHGTIIARINEQQFEITTLRIDKITDGRHAQVEFISDWKLDASRRDLTINSMFLDLDGTLHDYFNGEKDLKQKEIRFVGNPEERIKEDYLRIFRYFRFHARYGLAKKHDQGTLKTIKDNLNGLTEISGERIWNELKRIFTLKTCDDVIHVMINQIGMGKHIGLKDGQKDLNEFDKVLLRLNQANIPWEAVTLFSSLIQDDKELISSHLRLKLSNVERETVAYIINNNRDKQFDGDLESLKIQLALCPKSKQAHLKKNIIEYLKYSGFSSMSDTIEKWEIPSFPIKGDIIGKKVKKRKLIGLVIDDLKLVWAKNNFSLSDEMFEQELEKLLQNDKYKE